MNELKDIKTENIKVRPILMFVVLISDDKKSVVLSTLNIKNIGRSTIGVDLFKLEEIKVIKY